MADKRIELLQVLRGVAANLVVLSHLMFVEHKHLAGLLPDALTYGFAGVDIFFVLSGFVMVMVRGESPTAFLYDRVTRIYPPYWIVSAVVLVVALVAPAMVNSSNGGEVSVIKSFLLLPQPGLPLLAVGWTLIHEMYFYLVLAVAIAFRLPLPAFLCVWGIAVLGAHPFATSPAAAVAASPMTFEFIAGAFAALAYKSRKDLPPWPLLAAGIALFVAGTIAGPHVGLTWSAAEWQRVVLFGIPAALVVLGAALRDRRTRAPRLLVALGDWSYSTYLWHVLVLSALGRLVALLHLSPAVGLVAVVLLGIAVANLTGALSYRFLERPLLSRLRALRHRSKATSLSGTAVDQGLTR
jgi:exopolysaccharide production protein ExoZ